MSGIEAQAVLLSIGREKSRREIEAFVAEFCTSKGREVYDLSKSAEAGLDRALAVTLTSAVRDLCLKLDGLRLALDAQQQQQANTPDHLLGAARGFLP